MYDKNSQTIKVLKKIAVGLLILLGFLPFLGSLAMQMPSFQTWLGNRTIAVLGRYIDGEVEIGRMMVVFFSKVIVQDITVTGTPGDTLARVDKLSASISSRDLLRGDIRLTRVSVQGGVFNYLEEDSLGGSNLSRIFRIAPSAGPAKPAVFPALSVDEIRVRDFRFNFRSPFQPRSHNDPECIEFTDLAVSGINLRANRFRMGPDGISCRIQELEAADRSGFRVAALEGNFSFRPGEARIEDLHLNDGISDVHSRYLYFRFKDSESWNDFLNQVEMGADFHDTDFRFLTLGKITPELKGNNFRIQLDGAVRGPVSRLRSEALRIRSEGTDLTAAATVTGLPDIRKTRFEIVLDSCLTGTASIEAIVRHFSPDFRPGTLAGIAPGIPVRYSGSFNGLLSDLALLGKIDTPEGKAWASLQLDGLNTDRPLTFDGRIRTENLNLKALAAVPELGRLSADATFRASLPAAGQPAAIHLHSLQVDRLGLLGYEYGGIRANGELYGNTLDLKTVCHDPNLHFLLQARISQDGDSIRRFQTFIDLPYADLDALQLDRRGNVSQVSLNFSTDITRTPGGDFLGEAVVRHLDYTNDKGTHPIGRIEFRSRTEQQHFQASLNSRFLTAELNTEGSPAQAFGKIRRILLQEQFGSLFPEPAADSTRHAPKDSTGTLDLTVRTADMKALCQLIAPSLYLGENTLFRMSLDRGNRLEAEFESPLIAFGNTRIRGIGARLSNPESGLDGFLRTESIQSGNLSLQYAQLGLSAIQGTLHLETGFANSTALRNELFLTADIRPQRTEENGLRADILLQESYLYLQDRLWNIAPAFLTLAPDRYSISGMKLQSGEQSVTADGVYSSGKEDRLHLKIGKLDLSTLNSFLPEAVSLAGELNGEAVIASLSPRPDLFLDLYGSEVHLGENRLGNLNIKTKWDQNNNRFNILADHRTETANPLNIYGYYQPSQDLLSLTASVQSFPLNILQPFLRDILIPTDGSLSGEFRIYGTSSRLNLSGEQCRFNGFVFTPVYTRVPYTLDGPFEVTEYGINFSNLTLTDPAGNSARLGGGLTHRNFRDIYLDTRLDFRNLQCLNTTEKDNGTFYGTASLTGSVSVSGPTDRLSIEATAATAGNTRIHIPLSSSQSAAQKDLLSFVSPAELASRQVEEELEKAIGRAGRSGELEIRAKATVNPDAEILIEINKELGDVIRSQGSGTIDITVNPQKDILDLRGDYTIQEGSYRFVIMGLATKDFVIQEGGTVSFGGSIPNTTVNLTANYHTKASVATLISDTTSVGTRRDVICGISMSGPLLNPQISFNIDIPDLDPITKGRVESALSTEDKKIRQAMTLLISGSFLPDEQSGIVNTSSLLYSYTSEMLSNQVNNIFRQLDIPLDLGLNYQQDKKGQDIFDVALTTQFFNNRVIVNGNVGNVTKNTSTQSNWVGNLETEIKLDKDGKLRATLFTHSADDYSNYLDNTQRTGFGFSYQDEFSTFRELLRNIFWSRKRREAYELEQFLEAERELLREEEEIRKRRQVNGPKENPYQFMNL